MSALDEIRADLQKIIEKLDRMIEAERPNWRDDGSGPGHEEPR